jgi:hypothetical protein
MVAANQSPQGAPGPPDHGLTHNAATMRVEQRVEHVAKREQYKENAPSSA